MTAPERDWTPLEEDNAPLAALDDLDFGAPEAEDAEVLVSDSDTPAAPDPAPTPEVSAPPTLDVQAFNELVRNEQARVAQAAQPAAPAGPAPWVNPYERPGVQEEMNGLLERSFDPAAMQEYQRRTRDFESEIRQREIDERMGQFQANLRLESAAPDVVRQSFESVRGDYTDQITIDDYQRQAAEIFPDPASRARALDDRFNPQAQQTRQKLADMALGEAMRTGRIKPVTTPAPPPAVRSQARQTAAPPAAKNELMDNDYMDNYLANLSRRRKA